MSSQPKLQGPPKSADLDELIQMQLDATQDPAGRGDIEHIAGNVDDSYELPAYEDHLVHVRLTTTTANAETRSFEDASRIEKLSGPEFERMEKNEQFREFDKVEIVHDPRPKARRKLDETGDTVTGSPAEPKKPMRSTQDAQMRYFDLTGEHAPARMTFTELKALIANLEKQTGAQTSIPPALLTLADYQARFKELSDGKEAPVDMSIDGLKQIITRLEADAATK